MKKINFIIISVALAVSAASCKKDDTMEYPTPTPGTSYILEGTVATPGFTWGTMSSVGLYSATSGVKATNLECKIEGWAATNIVDEEGKPVPYTPSKYDGQATAQFNTPSLDLVKGENKFLVYTPYDAELTYLSGIIYGVEVAQNQTMPTTDVASSCFAYGECKGIPGVDATFKFTLNPACAMAKISVKSSEFAAKGYGLSKVTIYDEAGQVALGGAFDVNIEKGEVKTVEQYSRISTTITKTKTMTSGVAQNAYLQIMPGDFSSKELWVVIELTGEKGKVTIPVKKSGLKFNVGQTTEIAFDDLKASDCSVAWFCAEESRLTSGLGYAYGDANTYFIQCKNGSTWNGATYQVNNDIPDEVVIDYRARGDFFAATDPTGATFEWFSLLNGNLYTTRTAGYSANGTVVSKSTYTITQDAANYKVKVKNVGSYSGTPILVMKKDGKTLWAWTFWNIAADGTKVEPVDVSGYKLANMNIGQATTQYEKWIANKDDNSDPSKKNPDVIFRNDFEYQWGRPIPIFWTTFWSLDWYHHTDGTGTGNIPAIQGPLTLKESLEYPVGVIFALPDNTNLPHWDSDEKRASLWGAPAKGDISKALPEDVKGTKSIYDPCPKGWRVADYYALDALCKATKTFCNTTGMVGFYYGGSLFATTGYGNGKTANGGTRIATMGGGATGTASACSHGVLWTNYLGSESSNQPKAFYFRNEANAGTADGMRMATYNGSVSAPVRCQVDEANR